MEVIGSEPIIESIVVLMIKGLIILKTWDIIIDNMAKKYIKL
jgi:hypothetical protein